jgi:excisionase family DNA binding protein
MSGQGDRMDICTVREAARMLGVSEQRVRVLLSRGKLGGWKHGPMWAVSQASVQAWIRARAADQTA